jgi:uncharacterized protein (TIGR02246 family)
MQGDLEARVRRLEDIHEIQNLKSQYAHYANVGEGSGDIAKFAALFAADGVWDLRGNELRGREAIAAHLKHIGTLGYVGLHFALNPRVDVDGDAALGFWDLAFPVIPPGADGPVMVCGFYEDRLRRTEEGWRFTLVKYRVSESFSLAR